jgi:hypothetical protein
VLNEYGLVARNLDEDVVLLEEEEGGKSKEVKMKTLAKPNKESNGKAKMNKKGKPGFMELEEWD